MDVGYGGLEGENTTDYLRAHFNSINGLCKDKVAVDKYFEAHPAHTDNVSIGLYPDDLKGQYDLLVLDTNIEGNLDFWSVEGLAKAWSFVKDGGYIIAYIMGTDEYGDEQSRARLKEHRLRWWKAGGVKIPMLYLQEERRPEIMWALLKK